MFTHTTPLAMRAKVRIPVMRTFLFVFRGLLNRFFHLHYHDRFFNILWNCCCSV